MTFARSEDEPIQVPPHNIASGPPLVSTIIDNYNYGRYLKQAIDSVLSQDYPNIEVVVVDDGSTDNSRTIIEEYGDQIKSVLQPNKGQSAALNVGFAASTGSIIALLNSDDWFLPHKLSSIVQSFSANVKVQWVFDPVLMMFPDGKIVTNPSYENDIYVDVRHLAPIGKLGPMSPPHSGLAFRRALLERLLPMTTNIRMGSDNFLKFASMTLEPGLQLSSPLTAQRIHDANAGTMRTDRLLQKTRQHLLIAKELKMRIPAANRVSNKVFAKAAADYLRGLRRDKVSEAAISHYLNNCSVRELVDILPRTIYQFFHRIGSSG
jgi:glycosyltransferase involved in cell wall biosynthesis